MIWLNRSGSSRAERRIVEAKATTCCYARSDKQWIARVLRTVIRQTGAGGGFRRGLLRPDLLCGLEARVPAKTDVVLFLCTGNSARSIMAGAPGFILAQLAGLALALPLVRRPSREGARE